MGAPRRLTITNRAALLLVGSLVLSSLLGCGRPVDNAGPLAAARAFVAALEARDASAIIGLLEPSDWRKEIGPELRSYLGYLQALSLRDPEYRVERNDGASAQVRVSGTVSYTLAEDGTSGEHPVDLQVELVLVGGAWYMHSLDLPQTQ
jgi:hypothetical protein